jgi:hypothetical protein
MCSHCHVDIIFTIFLFSFRLDLIFLYFSLLALVYLCCQKANICAVITEYLLCGLWRYQELQTTAILSKGCSIVSTYATSSDVILITGRCSKVEGNTLQGAVQLTERSFLCCQSRGLYDTGAPTNFALFV